MFLFIYFRWGIYLCSDLLGGGREREREKEREMIQLPQLKGRGEGWGGLGDVASERRGVRRLVDRMAGKLRSSM